MSVQVVPFHESNITKTVYIPMNSYGALIDNQSYYALQVSIGSMGSQHVIPPMQSRFLLVDRSKDTVVTLTNATIASYTYGTVGGMVLVQDFPSEPVGSFPVGNATLASLYNQTTTFGILAPSGNSTSGITLSNSVSGDNYWYFFMKYQNWPGGYFNGDYLSSNALPTGYTLATAPFIITPSGISNPGYFQIADPSGNCYLGSIPVFIPSQDYLWIGFGTYVTSFPVSFNLNVAHTDYQGDILTNQWPCMWGHSAAALGPTNAINFTNFTAFTDYPFATCVFPVTLP